MFKIGQTEYGLHYNIARVRLLERALGSSIMSIVSNSQGLFSIDQLSTCLMYGLIKKDATAHVGLAETEPLVEKLFEKETYEGLCKAVIVQLSEDCPFLFPKN